MVGLFFLVRLAFSSTGLVCRGKNQRNKGLSIVGFAEEGDGLPSTSSVAGGSGRNSSGFSTVPKLDQDTVLLTLRDKLRMLGQRLHEVKLLLQKKLCLLVIKFIVWLLYFLHMHEGCIYVVTIGFVCDAHHKCNNFSEHDSGTPL